MNKKPLALLIPSVFIVLSFIAAGVEDITLFENQTWESNMTPARFGAMALGDINNDGKMDIVSTGCLSDGANDCENGVITKIYINNGTTMVENQTWQQNLVGVGLSSVAFCDIDNDGNIDLALTGCDTSTNFNCNGNRYGKIYINNGTSFVENQTWENNFTAVTEGSLSCGDIDGNGYLDLVQTGSKLTSPWLIAKIYINNGTSLLETPQWQSSLQPVQRGNVAFGDINNDGKLDLVLSGYKETVTEVSKIYINNGTSLVENQTWQQGLTQMGESSVLLGDYNNDGRLDLVMNGHTTGDRFHVYNNNGTSLVLNQTESGSLAGIYSSSVAFGDYNNDGNLDLVGMGWEHGRTFVYRNNENIYDIDQSASYDISSDLYEGSLAWSDFNADGNVDLIAVGIVSGQGLAAKVYISNGTVANHQPGPPNESLLANYSGQRLALSWGNGTDNETPVLGLYYNLRAGTCSGCHDIVTGVYGGNSGSNEGGGGGANGYFGNMMQRRSITLNRQFAPGTKIYWAVQTIDTGLAKSNWSVEQVYNVTSNAPLVAITYPSASTYYNVTYFNFSSNETADSCWYRIGGANITIPACQNGTALSLPEGSRTLEVYANDSNDNVGGASLQFTLDSTPPALSITSPGNSSYGTQEVTVSISSSGSQSVWWNNGTANLTYSAPLNYNFTTGTHTILAWTNDTINNMNFSSVTFTIDIVTVQLANVTNSNITAIRAYVEWDTTEPGNASVSLGTNASALSVNATNSSFTLAHNLTLQYLTKNTTYHYNVTSCDAAGNCNTTGPYNFTTPECSSSWSCGSWSTCTGSQSRSCTDTNYCQYPFNSTETQSCTVPASTGGTIYSFSPIAAIATIIAQNASAKASISPGAELANNPNMQSAVEKLMGANMTAEAEDSMLLLSKALSSNMEVSREFNTSGRKSSITTKLKYSGTATIRNFIVFEKIPKEFAAKAGLVIVNAPGANVSVVDEDPSWAVLYPEIAPGEERHITYETGETRNYSVLGDVRTEVYAQSLVEKLEPAAMCAPASKRCSGNGVQQCTADGLGWETKSKCDYGCDTKTLSCNPAPSGGIEEQTNPAGFPVASLFALVIAVLSASAAGALILKFRRRRLNL